MKTETRQWIRVCQECGNRQIDTPPPEANAAYERWEEHKCKVCKSHGLNYGGYICFDDKPTGDE